MTPSGSHVCMNSDTSVSLREYIERIVREHERSTQQALEVAAKEYERRLDALNHEYSRIREIQVSCVSREVYDMRHDELERRLASIEKLVYVGVGGVVLLGTMIQVALHFWR